MTAAEDRRRQFEGGMRPVDFAAFLALPENARRRAAKDVPRLYKFRTLDPLSDASVDRARALIVNDEIWLSRASEFNDPFEGRFRFEIERSPDIRRAAVQRLRGLNANLGQSEWDRLVERFADMSPEVPPQEEDGLRQKFDSELGFFCAAQSHRSMTMWAHYAFDHKGFCVRYAPHEDPLLVVAMEEVVYSPEYPVLMGFTDRQVNPALYYLRKSPAWRDEKEWRIVTPIGPGPMKLQPAAMAGIILGCRMPAPVREALMTLIEERARLGKPRPPLYQMHIHRSTYGLGAFQYGKTPPSGWVLP